MYEKMLKRFDHVYKNINQVFGKKLNVYKNVNLFI